MPIDLTITQKHQKRVFFPTSQRDMHLTMGWGAVGVESFCIFSNNTCRDHVEAIPTLNSTWGFDCRNLIGAPSDHVNEPN